MFAGVESTPAEAVLDYLVDRRIESSSGKLSVGRLGMTLLAYAQEAQAAMEGILAVELRPGDPLAGVEVFMAIKNVGPCLIVNPYCREPQLLELLRHTEAGRLLRSSDTKDDLGLLLQMAPRSFEVRETTAIHDRFIIPGAGSVLMLGSSLSGIGGKPSILITLPDELGESVRDRHEVLWTEASPVGAETSGAA